MLYDPYFPKKTPTPLPLPGPGGSRRALLSTVFAALNRSGSGQLSAQELRPLADRTGAWVANNHGRYGRKPWKTWENPWYFGYFWMTYWRYLGTRCFFRWWIEKSMSFMFVKYDDLPTTIWWFAMLNHHRRAYWKIFTQTGLKKNAWHLYFLRSRSEKIRDRRLGMDLTRLNSPSTGEYQNGYWTTSIFTRLIWGSLTSQRSFVWQSWMI